MTSVFISFTSFLCFSCGKEVTQMCIRDRYGMISAIGVRNVVENRVDFTNSRNLIVAAVILVCALGFNSVGGLTFAVGGVAINLSGLAIAAIVGILLNACLLYTSRCV